MAHQREWRTTAQRGAVRGIGRVLSVRDKGLPLRCRCARRVHNAASDTLRGVRGQTLSMLSADIVDEIARACLFGGDQALMLKNLVDEMKWTKEEITEAWPDLILVEGLVRSYGFNRVA